MFSMTLSGRSVLDFYELIRKRFDEITSPERLHFFLADERIKEDERNSLLIEQTFFSYLAETGKIPSENFHRIRTSENLSEIAEIYTKELGSLSPGLYFDLIVLGSGEDGHIASLFPGHKEIMTEQKGYASLDNSPKPPSERITLLPGSIINSKSAFLFFIGDGKNDAYRNFRSTDKPKDNEISLCPSLIVKKIKNYWVFSDINL